MRWSLARTLALAVLPGGSLAQERAVFVVPLSAEPSWRDDAFLAAVPAAARDGRDPIVLAVDAAAPWRPELLDFLRRYDPARIWWLGGQAAPGGPSRVEIESLVADSAEDAACAVAGQLWPKTTRAVIYEIGDRSAALAAAVLAARLHVPLLPGRDGAVSTRVEQALDALGVRHVLQVGTAAWQKLAGRRTEVLAGAEDVVRWLAKEHSGVDYLAVVNPDDRHLPHGSRLSLAAVLLAAGRRGAIAPIPVDPRWKLRFPAAAATPRAPKGARDSRSGWRTGRIDLGHHQHAFTTGSDPRDGRHWLQVDLDGNGELGGPGEGPFRTGEVAAIGDRRWVVDLDADEKSRGELRLTSPPPDEVVTRLTRLRRAAGRDPTYLCLVGWPEALPLAVIGDGQGVDADLVSDLPYGQTDGDPFVELALARFVAEDVAAATLLACRGLALDDFRERGWEHSFATAEWAGDCRPLLLAAGLRDAGHHAGSAVMDARSPLTGVQVIVHGSHAMWTELGKTCRWDSTVLLAPCLVESSGCSTASLDQDAEHRSVAARLLRNGAVAFAGNSRRGVAQQQLFRSELWNALLEGQTLGEANRTALNRLLLAMLDKGETTAGLYRYQLYNAAVYGDPALPLRLGRPSADRARVEVRDRRATVHAPGQWPRVEYTPLAEWGCAYPTLYTWRGAGMGIECRWHAPEKRNQDDLYFTAEVRTRQRLIGVEPLDTVAPPLGWTGRAFLDDHADGTRSILWRTRLIDFDMTTGQVRAKVDRLRFRLRGE